MKLLVKIGKNLTAQAEGNTPADLIKEIAAIQETFQDSKCGLCGSEDLKYIYRKVDDYEFYELYCTKCRGKLTFGNPKQKPGYLYPKRYETTDKGKALKDESGKAKMLGQYGWFKWTSD